MSSLLNLVTLGSVGKNNSLHINDHGQSVERGIVCHVDVSDDEIPASFSEIDSNVQQDLKLNGHDSQNTNTNNIVKNHRASTGSMPNSSSSGSMYSLNNRPISNKSSPVPQTSSMYTLNKSSITTPSSKPSAFSPSNSSSTSPVHSARHSPLPTASPVLWTIADSLNESLNRAELNLRTSKDFIRRRASTGGEELFNQNTQNILNIKTKSMNDINNESLYQANTEAANSGGKSENEDDEEDFGEITSIDNTELFDSSTPISTPQKERHILVNEINNSPTSSIPLTPPTYDQLFSFPAPEETEHTNENKLKIKDADEEKDFSTELDNQIEFNKPYKIDLPPATLTRIEKKINNLINSTSSKANDPMSNITIRQSTSKQTSIPSFGKSTRSTSSTKVPKSISSRPTAPNSTELKQKEVDRQRANRLKEIEKQNEIERLREIEKKKEMEKRKEIERIREIERQKRLEKQKEMTLERSSRSKVREVIPLTKTVQLSKIPISNSRSASAPRYSNSSSQSNILSSSSSIPTLIRSTSTPRTILTSNPSSTPKPHARLSSGTSSNPSSPPIKSTAVLTSSPVTKSSSTPVAASRISRQSLPASNLFSPQSVKKTRQSMSSSNTTATSPRASSSSSNAFMSPRVTSSSSSSSFMSPRISSSTSTTAKRSAAVSTPSSSIKPRQSLSGLTTEKKSTKLSIGQSTSSLSITKKKVLSTRSTSSTIKPPLDRSEILASKPQTPKNKSGHNESFSSIKSLNEKMSLSSTCSLKTDSKRQTNVNPFELFSSNEINSMRERSRSRSKSRSRSNSISAISSSQSLNASNINSNDLKLLFQNEMLNSYSTPSKRSDSICSINSVTSNSSTSSQKLVQTTLLNSSGRIQTNSTMPSKVSSSSIAVPASITVTPINSISTPFKSSPSKPDLPPQTPISATKKLFQNI